MGAHLVVRVAAKPAIGPGGFPATAPPPAVVQFPPPAVALPYPSAAVPYVSFPVATISLRAEWPLKGESLEEIVGAAETLKEDIASLDLGRSKAAKGSSSKDKGDGENTIQEPTYVPGSVGSVYPAPQGPTFSYVASVSKGESKAALVEAFADAKLHGAKLAAVAGMGLGPIVSINEQTYHVFNAVNGGYPAPAVFSYSAASDAGVGDKPESAGPTAESLGFQFQVSVVFSLLPSQPEAKGERAAKPR